MRITKETTIFLSVLAGLIIAHIATAQTAPNYLRPINSNTQLTPINSSYGLKIPSGTTTTLAAYAGATGCLSVDSIGNITTSTCSGGGSGTVTTTTPVTVGNFPYWTKDGGLAGSSTISINTSTLALTLGTTTIGNTSGTNLTLTGQFTSSNITDTSVVSALDLDNSAGTITAYTGSTNPCAANQAPTTLSATGVLGGCTATFLTAAITSFNGSTGPTINFNVIGGNGATTTVTTSGGNSTTTVIVPQGKYLGLDSAFALTVSSTIASGSITFNIYDPTSTAPYKYAKWRTQTSISITSVYCDEYAPSATTTIELYVASTTATTTVASDIVPSILCGNAGATTSTFTTSTLLSDNFLIANVTSTASGTNYTTVTVYYKKL